MYWPEPSYRIVVPVSAPLVDVIVSSTPDGGVDPAVFLTEICGLSPETAAPVQSVTLIFTGIVLPYLKMLGSWCACVSFTGCSTPLAVYRWDTALVLELLVPKPPSLSVTVTITVKPPGPYVWVNGPWAPCVFVEARVWLPSPQLISIAHG